MKTIHTILTVIQAHAQSDLAKALGGLKVEEDNSAFVPNAFIGDFTVEQRHYKNGEERKSSPNTLHYFGVEDKTLMYSTDQEGTDNNTRILIDLRTKYTYSLSPGSKGHMSALKVRKKNLTVKELKDGKQPEVTVTAETRAILGHTCVKTIIKDEHGTVPCWIKEDVPAPFGDMMRNMVPTGSTDKSKGFALESEFIDADGKNRSTNTVKELRFGPVDAVVFSLDGYEVQELPSFGN